MPRPLLEDMTTAGGLCRRNHLLALGHDRHAITAAVGSEVLFVPRRGWVASAIAPSNAIRAVQLGGLLGGASSLGSRKIWVDDDSELVVSCQPTSSDSGALLPGEPRVWIAHVDDRSAAVPWRVSVIDGLVQLAKDVSRDSLIASVDSALNLRFLTASDYRMLLRALSRRLRSIHKEIDGKAMSGTETHMRLAVVRAGYLVQTQVKIPGVGTVDLLIDGWLIIELDSKKHHDGQTNQFRDRTRDGNSVIGGFGHERFVWQQVYYDIDWCLNVVAARLREGPPARR